VVPATKAVAPTRLPVELENGGIKLYDQ
jgi:hypothetical protein